MEIAFHRYTLVPRRPLGGIAREGVREGALLRVDGGYADLHPWPELGDLALDDQLALLARGEPTPQTRASLRMARVDAAARGRAVSLFEGLTIPESHWPGSEPPAGFDTVKTKGVKSVASDLRVRIDFNATLTAGEFRAIARTLPRDQIDFVEDPCPYDAETWKQLREETGLRLALDVAGDYRMADVSSFDVLVHKPALSEEFPAYGGEIVVTSYMDHPIGQFGAAWVAATHRVSARCGLFTHVLYEPDEFIGRIRSEAARLRAPRGTGIGFDDLLEKLPWKSIG